jgi:hypothetical protein
MQKDTKIKTMMKSRSIAMATLLKKKMKIDHKRLNNSSQVKSWKKRKRNLNWLMLAHRSNQIAIPTITGDYQIGMVKRTASMKTAITNGIYLLIKSRGRTTKIAMGMRNVYNRLEKNTYKTIQTSTGITVSLKNTQRKMDTDFCNLRSLWASSMWAWQCPWLLAYFCQVYRVVYW